MSNKTHKHILIITAALAVLLACSTCPASEPVAPVSQEYRIGNENILQIDVYFGKGEKMSQKVKVSARGFISFPLLGEIEARGLTVYQLEKKLADELGKDYIVNPQVSVFVEQYSTVSVLGEVEKPGAYPIEGEMTVTQLVAVAGGFTKIAAPNNTKVIRALPDGSKQEIRAKVKDIINGREADIPLKTGDMVVVAESMF